MQDGIDYINTFAWHGSKGISYSDKCCLETILAAGLCPNVRVCQWFPDVSPACSRCGHHTDDLLHFCWTCPANADIDDKAVKDSQDLIPTAKVKFANETCLWTRGIIPASLSLEALNWECNNPMRMWFSTSPWTLTVHGVAPSMVMPLEANFLPIRCLGE